MNIHDLLDRAFERPAWLWLLPIFVLIIGVVNLMYRTPVSLKSQWLQCCQKSMLQTLLTIAAIALLIVAAAGPRWSPAGNVETASGQDIVVVLDVSNSMLARDALPNRLQRARQLLQQLLPALERRGGHRVAILAFAFSSMTLCPLTYDLGFAATNARESSDSTYPETRSSGATSGTRIGSALVHAGKLLRAGGAASGRILLLSDGDDPARDAEWRRALELNIPIDVIALGDPGREAKVPGLAQAASRMQVEVLRELAAATGGIFIADHDERVDMSEFAARASAFDQRNVGRTALAQPPARPAPFLLASLACLTGALLHVRRSAVLAGGAAVLTVAAGPIDHWIEHGNREFYAGRPESALQRYSQAAEKTDDPGLVAFNQGVALASLGRYRDAELHFRRCMSDAEGNRRAKALFNLGTCLVRRSGGADRVALNNAVATLRLAQALAQEDLAEAAMANLEIAEKLLAQLPPENSRSPVPERDKQQNSIGTNAGPGVAADANDSNEQPGRDRRALNDQKTGRSTVATPPPGKGNLPRIPDSEQLASIPPEDLKALLGQIEERIAAAIKHRQTNKVLPPNPNYPDW